MRALIAGTIVPLLLPTVAAVVDPATRKEPTAAEMVADWKASAQGQALTEVAAMGSTRDSSGLSWDATRSRFASMGTPRRRAMIYSEFSILPWTQTNAWPTSRTARRSSFPWSGSILVRRLKAGVHGFVDYRITARHARGQSRRRRRSAVSS